MISLIEQAVLRAVTPRTEARAKASHPMTSSLVTQTLKETPKEDPMGAIKTAELFSEHIDFIINLYYELEKIIQKTIKQHKINIIIYL